MTLEGSVTSDRDTNLIAAVVKGWNNHKVHHMQSLMCQGQWLCRWNNFWWCTYKLMILKKYRIGWLKIKEIWDKETIQILGGIHHSSNYWGREYYRFQATSKLIRKLLLSRCVLRLQEIIAQYSLEVRV